VRLISELKRRNVLRMAVLYVVAAWLVVQVADALIGLAGLPEWAGQVVLAVLAIGFPIALVISWFYEITPEGLALEKDVPEGASITHATGRRMDFIVIAVLAAGLILFAADKWWPQGPLERSIAVLAFDNMSGVPDEEFFSDGISEEILNLLAQIRPLKVIARQSSFFFKDKDTPIATIAEQLNVGWVLEGSVRRHDQQVRVTAQLIDARDSTHVWSHTYDRDLSSATENTEAYTAYLLGRERLRDRKVDELAQAVEQFALAIELDPEFAAAYSGLADACLLYHQYSGSHTYEACPIETNATGEEISASLMPLVNKALELDDQAGEAWITRGAMLQMQVNGLPESMPKLREAHAAFERGLELSPSYSQGYHWYALSLPYTQFYEDFPYGWIKAWEQDTWQSVVRRGLEIDPLSVPLHTLLSDYGLWSKELDEAYRHAHRVVEIAPDSPLGYERLADLSQHESGRMDEAIKWRHKAAQADEKSPEHPSSIGDAYAALGDLEMALAYYGRVRGIIPADATEWQHRILMAEASAWLGSRREHADANARDRLALSDVYDAGRLEIELSLDSSKTLAQELLSRFKDQNPVCFTYDAEHDEGACPPVVYFLYGELGDAEIAQRALENLFEGNKEFSVYNPIEKGPAMLTALSLLRRHEEAFDLLEELVQKGWRGDGRGDISGGHRFNLYRNVLLDAIRDHPRFQAMVAVIESDMAEQLENVREMERKGELPTLEEVRAGLSIQ
jgi:TolB-like protein